MPDVDDGSIGDGAALLRRIHPEQVVPDSNDAGRMRPSSAAFKDPNLSVDAEPLLSAAGLNWQFSLRNHPNYYLVRFLAGFARRQRLAVVHKPEADNPAHTEVIGKKTQGIANALRDASTWAVAPSEPPP
jgi:hypothetical protein